MNELLKRYYQSFETKRQRVKTREEAIGLPLFPCYFFGYVNLDGRFCGYKELKPFKRTCLSDKDIVYFTDINKDKMIVVEALDNLYKMKLSDFNEYWKK